MRKERVYLAGPISSKMETYKKDFATVEAWLTADGCSVLSPAWLPSEGFERKQYLRIGLAMLQECDAIAMLPGWEESAGAQAELRRAEELGLDIIFVNVDYN